MKTSLFTVVFFILNSYIEVQSYGNISYSCGQDRSPVTVLYEGAAAIETYPWMGLLYYPTGNNLRFTTTVVLVTRQMVITTAGEIDKLPKARFRSHARVVLGRKCGAGEIRVRSYTYHPEYDRYSTSALAIVQLETDHLKMELRPICQPPAYFYEPQYYAMTLTGDCKNPKVMIHKMKYVNIENCRNYYRKSGLNQSTIWPAHTACARAVSGGRCVWRSGSVLAVKQDGRWRLLGFSVYGPGCGAPARFLHYGMYYSWVLRTSHTVGQPAITRLGDDHIVMRRSMANVQKYGPCDPDETIAEIYTDKVTIGVKYGKFGESYRARYNVSIYADIEYSCIVFKARYLTKADYIKLGLPPQPVDYSRDKPRPKPWIRLRRWCASTSGMCHDFQYLEIQFYVEINFTKSVEFNVLMYGRASKIIAPARALHDANSREFLRVPTLKEAFGALSSSSYSSINSWY